MGKLLGEGCGLLYQTITLKRHRVKNHPIANCSIYHRNLCYTSWDLLMNDKVKWKINEYDLFSSAKVMFFYWPVVFLRDSLQSVLIIKLIIVNNLNAGSTQFSTWIRTCHPRILLIMTHFDFNRLYLECTVHHITYFRSTN